jgi:site-specific DNA-methyltransferase (adenine-specific)
MAKQNYVIPKKTLQLEVKRVARLLGHLPNREELALLGQYDIEYYDRYFVSWGEVCAAARTTGMSEVRKDLPLIKKEAQPALFDFEDG